MSMGSRLAPRTGSGLARHHRSRPHQLRSDRKGEIAMTANVGTVDRVARIVVGLALIAVALGLFGPAYQTVWGWLGIIPLATGLVSWCPAYAILGTSTCKRALSR
jgi:hypothetical protein